MGWEEHTGGEWLLVINARAYASVSPVRPGWWRWVAQLPPDHPRLNESVLTDKWWGVSGSDQVCKERAEDFLKEFGVNPS